MEMIDASFWKSRKVFLTGHTGFKGSWLAQWLVSMGANVRGFSLEPPTSPNLFTALGLDRELDHVIGDIRDAARIEKAVCEFQPEVIFHLAAQPLVRLSYKEPILTYETNVLGTLNLYEAIRRCGSVGSVVSVTTDKCYENREWLWGYREDEPMGGYDPYSSSKACVEILTSSYRRSFFNPSTIGSSQGVALATARAGNVIGGGDWAADRLVPDCIRSLSKKESIVIRNPRSVRPWQHVLEPIAGYLLLAQRLACDGVKVAEAWNFGPSEGDTMDVEAVVKMIIKSWGAGHYMVAPDAGFHEARLLRLDASKARTLLGWLPRWDCSEAVKKTVEWYSNFYNGGNAKDITIAQTKSYAASVI